jgi:hypothetical protein
VGRMDRKEKIMLECISATIRSHLKYAGQKLEADRKIVYWFYLYLFLLSC